MSERLELKTLRGAGSIFAPRLCEIRRRDHEDFGFSLHSDGNDTPGQHFVTKVYPGSPARRAGLRDGDRIIAVNGRNAERMTHGAFLATVTAGGRAISLEVVDTVADLHYRRQQEVKAEAKVTGDVTSQGEGPAAPAGFDRDPGFRSSTPPHTPARVAMATGVHLHLHGMDARVSAAAFTFVECSRRERKRFQEEQLRVALLVANSPTAVVMETSSDGGCVVLEQTGQGQGEEGEGWDERMGHPQGQLTDTSDTTVTASEAEEDVGEELGVQEDFYSTYM